MPTLLKFIVATSPVHFTICSSEKSFNTSWETQTAKSMIAVLLTTVHTALAHLALVSYPRCALQCDSRCSRTYLHQSSSLQGKGTTKLEIMLAGNYHQNIRPSGSFDSWYNKAMFSLWSREHRFLWWRQVLSFLRLISREALKLFDKIDVQVS